MPSFSKSLENALHQALSLASNRRHEYATLEHLLLALLDDEDATAVMEACNVKLEDLRRTVTNYIDNELDALISRERWKPSPRPGSSASSSAR